MPTTLSLLTLILTLLFLTATAKPTPKPPFNIHITAVQREPGNLKLTPNTVRFSAKWNQCTKWSEIWKLAGDKRMDEMQFKASDPSYKNEQYHIIFYRDDACKGEYGYIAGAASKDPMNVAITGYGIPNPVWWNIYKPAGENQGKDYQGIFPPQDVFTGLKSFKVGKGACRNRNVYFGNHYWPMCIAKPELPPGQGES